MRATKSDSEIFEFFANISDTVQDIEKSKERKIVDLVAFYKISLFDFSIGRIITELNQKKCFRPLSEITRKQRKISKNRKRGKL